MILVRAEMRSNPGEAEQTIQCKLAFQSGHLGSESAVHYATLRDVNSFSFFCLSSTPPRPHYISTISRVLSSTSERAEPDDHDGARQHNELVNFTYFHRLRSRLLSTFLLLVVPDVIVFSCRFLPCFKFLDSKYSSKRRAHIRSSSYEIRVVGVVGTNYEGKVAYCTLYTL